MELSLQGGGGSRSTSQYVCCHLCGIFFCSLFPCFSFCPPPSYFTTWKLPSPCFPSPPVSVGCRNCIFQKFRTGRGESHSHHQPPPKLLSLPCSAYESQRSQYLQSSKSWTVECCCCCGGECLASSRQPAGSEGGVGLWKRTEKCLYN